MLFFFRAIFIMISFSIAESFAAQWAKVVTEKAIIYADQECKSPIGFIANGKKVRVGEVIRNQGKVLPIVIQEKIAYIKVKDLNLSYDAQILTGQSQRLKEMATTKTHEKRLSINYNAMLTTASTEGGDEWALFHGFGVRAYNTELKRQRSWRMGVDFGRASIESYQLDALSFSIEYGVGVLQTAFYDFQLYAGGNLIPYSQFSRGGDFKQNGYGYGARLGAEMLFKFKRFAVHLDGNYQYNKLYFRLHEDILNELAINRYEPTLAGFRFATGISFAF
jgi:hypothetical protein